MGAQILLCDGFEVVPPPGMNDLIIFGSDQSGSNCDDSTVTTEEDGTVFSGDSTPGGAAEEEWPGAIPFSFYFVKQPVYDDPEIKAKINESDQEIYRCNKLRIDISNTQKSERAEISSLLAQMESLAPKSEGYKVVFEEKKSEFDTLLEALRDLRCSSSNQFCFSEEELDHLIYIAHYVIEHGSIGLEEEDWVLKETDKSFRTVASICYLKSMAVELNEVKKELDAITSDINQLTDKMGKIQNKIRVLDEDMAHILEKRDKSYERIIMLRIQRDKGNAAFFQRLAVMRKAAANSSTSESDKSREVINDLETVSGKEKTRRDHCFQNREVSGINTAEEELNLFLKLS